MNINKPDLQNIGNAGEYFVASLLSSKGYTASLTLGRTEGFDIIAISPHNKKAVKIQVKTIWSLKTTHWRLSKKNENNISKDFFYIFVRMNDLKKNPDYWTMPSKIIGPYVKKRHKIWLRKLGLHQQKHNDNPGRSYSLKIDKYTPRGITQKMLDRGYNNIDVIEKYCT